MALLLTNDDGYQAAGLQALSREVARTMDVVVVAPASEMSGVSHALTLSRPLTVERVAAGVHAVDGTPTDCVNLALNRLLAEPPEACVSGINHGGNLGDDVSYSGTVGAAYEATLFGIPSLAVSQVRGGAHASFEPAARLAAALARLLATRRLVLPPGTFLNLNVPDGAVRGVSVTRLARRRYHDETPPTADALGRLQYWVGGRPEWQSEPGTDHDAVSRHGHASLSLLGTDLSLAAPGLEEAAALLAAGLDALRAELAEPAP